MMNSSIRFSLTGRQVGWITKTSWPRTESPILTSISPSLKRFTSISVRGMLISDAIRAPSSGLAVPERRRRSPWGLLTVRPPGGCAGGHVGPRPHPERGDQAGVGADEGAVADDGAVLALAVVVAGDRAGAHVDV